jgi:hypothetical protein
MHNHSLINMISVLIPAAWEFMMNLSSPHSNNPHTCKTHRVLIVGQARVIACDSKNHRMQLLL